MSAMRGLVTEAPSADVRNGVAEIVGRSDLSVDAAIDDGVARAAGAAHVEWIEVTAVRSNVLGGTHRYLVGLRLGLRPAV